MVDPVACSPKDTVQQRECSVQSDNTVGFYESSSWEYSWFVPHDTAHLIILMGGNVSQNMQPNPRDNERAQKSSQTGHLYPAIGPLPQHRILLARERAILPGMFSSPTKICALNIGVTTDTDANWVPLRKRACELRRRRAESCLHKL